MGNYRGNTYGKEHLELDPDGPPFDCTFWEFSWDHNGQFDIPAMIDKVLAVTGHDKIHYVGHSMGTTAFMVMADLRPEYLDKVIMANLMAPVAYVENMKSPIRLLAPFVNIIEVGIHLMDWVKTIAEQFATSFSGSHRAAGHMRVPAFRLVHGPLGGALLRRQLAAAALRVRHLPPVRKRPHPDERDALGDYRAQHAGRRVHQADCPVRARSQFR